MLRALYTQISILLERGSLERDTGQVPCCAGHFLESAKIIQIKLSNFLPYENLSKFPTTLKQKNRPPSPEGGLNLFILKSYFAITGRNL